MHRTARDAEPYIMEAMRAFCHACIFITDIEPTQKGQTAVNDGHLPVVTPVEPGQPPPEGGNIEGNQLNALLCHTLEKGEWGFDGADVVVNQQDTHTSSDGPC